MQNIQNYINICFLQVKLHGFFIILHLAKYFSEFTHKYVLVDNHNPYLIHNQSILKSHYFPYLNTPLYSIEIYINIFSFILFFIHLNDIFILYHFIIFYAIFIQKWTKKKSYQIFLIRSLNLFLLFSGHLPHLHR